jgi:predicted nucleic acid-binding protein
MIEKNGSSIYADSSALIKLYFTEHDSKAVADLIIGLQEPLPFSHLHELEIKNGLRLKVFRGEASQKSADSAIRLIEQDYSAGVLQRPDLNWFDVFRKAEALSQHLSARAGSRSLDLLHVASAILLEKKDFLTFDDRQAELVRKAGLNCIRL